ncbi:MAG: hypothetical protein ABI969_18900, partial [bacterium]
MLHAVAQIAAALATGDAPSEVLPGVLERIADTVGASSVSLWLGVDGELRCEARVGGSPPSGAALRAELISPTLVDEGFVVVRLDAAHKQLGALVLSAAGSLSPDQRTFLATIADILAPVLRQTAHAQRL